MVVYARILELDREAERIEDLFYPHVRAGAQKERVIEPAFNMAYIIVAHFVTGTKLKPDIQPRYILECLNADVAQPAYIPGRIGVWIGGIAVGAPVIARGFFACFRFGWREIGLVREFDRPCFIVTG